MDVAVRVPVYLLDAAIPAGVTAGLYCGGKVSPIRGV